FLQKGVVVRHLLLPGHVGEAQKVTEYVYNTYGDNVYISLMNQFTPVNNVPGLNRSVTEREYNRLLDYALALGVENCMIQEFGTAQESFIPPFDGTGM
ncbi:MAG: radical SAM protein, partial [Clostridia bacterium]|nr:radical SAM protein [Clostridia bacterium]